MFAALGKICCSRFSVMFISIALSSASRPPPAGLGVSGTGPGQQVVFLLLNLRQQFLIAALGVEVINRQRRPLPPV